MPGMPLLFCLMYFLLMHPVHQTISEVQWNAKTSRVEVAIRLDVLDEQWIDKNFVKKDIKTDAGRLECLRRQFRVSPLPKQGHADTAKYRWVGRQSDGAHAWWYFEILPPEGKQPDWLEIMLLFDRTGNYQHRIVFLNENPKRSVDLNRERPRASFQPATDTRLQPKALQYD